jgi:hypothetical protein
LYTDSLREKGQVVKNKEGVGECPKLGTREVRDGGVGFMMALRPEMVPDKRDARQHNSNALNC